MCLGSGRWQVLEHADPALTHVEGDSDDVQRHGGISDAAEGGGLEETEALSTGQAAGASSSRLALSPTAPRVGAKEPQG